MTGIPLSKIDKGQRTAGECLKCFGKLGFLLVSFVFFLSKVVCLAVICLKVLRLAVGSDTLRSGIVESGALRTGTLGTRNLESGKLGSA